MINKEDPFWSQSETLIEHLVDERGYSEEAAEKLWFNSKTYKEIIRRELTYISAMRALYELDKELEGKTDWMDKPFDC